MINAVLYILGIMESPHTAVTQSVRKDQPRKITDAVSRRELCGPIDLDRVIIERTYALSTKESIGFKVYAACILGLLCIQPVHAILSARTSISASNAFFQCIPPTQFVLSRAYFSTYHFHQFYLSNVPRCFPNVSTLLLLCTLFTMVTSAISALSLHTGIDIGMQDAVYTGFDDISLGGRVALSIVLFVSWMYGSMIVYVNLVCFSLVFCKHAKIIKDYVKKLEFEDSYLVGLYTLNDLVQDIMTIRHELEHSIDLLTNTFSAFTLLGAIELALYADRIRNGNFDRFPWMSFALYAIVQSVFLAIVLRVSSQRESIQTLLKRPRFVRRFLKRFSVRDMEMLPLTDLVLVNMEEENANAIDFLLLEKIVDERWTTFTVMGLDVSRGDLIKKGILLVTTVVALTNFIQ